MCRAVSSVMQAGVLAGGGGVGQEAVAGRQIFLVGRCVGQGVVSGSKLFFLDVKSYFFSTYLFLWHKKKDFALKKRFRAKKKDSALKKRFLHNPHVCLKKLHRGGYKECYCIKPTPAHVHNFIQ